MKVYFEQNCMKCFKRTDKISPISWLYLHLCSRRWMKLLQVWNGMSVSKLRPFEAKVLISFSQPAEWMFLSWSSTPFIYITDLTFRFLLIYSGSVWTLFQETSINLHSHLLSLSLSCLSLIYPVSRRTWALWNRWAGLAWCNGTDANYSSWHKHFCWLPPMHYTFCQG